MDADYVVNLVVLVNPPASSWQALRGIGLYLKPDE